MKKYIYLLTAALALGLAACSTERSGVSQDGDLSGGGVDYGNESLSGGYPLAERIPGLNPEDGDFSILAAYIVHFDFDSFTIKASERPKLEAVARWLSENPGAKIVIAGHTDSRGTIQYNLALGERRALAARDYLLGLGVNANALTTVSYGKERPAQAGENEGAWAANRRAEFGVVR